MKTMESSPNSQDTGSADRSDGTSLNNPPSTDASHNETDGDVLSETLGDASNDGCIDANADSSCSTVDSGQNDGASDADAP